MQSKLAMLTVVFILSACGRNPYITEITSEKSGALPLLESQRLEADQEPELILRDKESGKEDILDMGRAKKGERLSRIWELINIGEAKAQDIKLPSQIGPFTITNLNCREDLEVKEACLLKGEIETFNDANEKGLIEIAYSGSKKENLGLKAVVVAEEEAEIVIAPKPEEKLAKVILINKHEPSGIVFLKNIPVGDSKEVYLELKNVGNLDADKLTLPKVNEPFILKNISCKENLKIDESCEVVIIYSPKKEGDSKANLSFTYSPKPGEQKKLSNDILASAVKMQKPAILVVDNSYINQEVFDVLGIKPADVSPFQYIRAVDLGNIIKGEETKFKLVINNEGDKPANIIDLKKFKGTMYSNIGGTCADKMSITKTCTINGTLKSSKLGPVYDVTEISYQDESGVLRRLSVLVKATIKEPTVSETYLCRQTKEARNNADQEMKIAYLKQEKLYLLPYKTKNNVTSAKLDLLTNYLNNKNYRVSHQGRSYVVPAVKNAEVQFGFRLSEADLVDVVDIKLSVDILKLSDENQKFETTEILCLNETRQCSGAFFIDSNFGELKTTNYSLANNLFSKELLKSVITNPGEICYQGTIGSAEAATATTKTHRLKTELSLKDLLNLNEAKLKTMTGIAKRGFNFVLSDDSLLLSTPKLILIKKSETPCK
ncbi:MAG: hypothetical protein ACOYL6_00445 [Bacteriovoracaceae bacterium]